MGGSGRGKEGGGGTYALLTFICDVVSEPRESALAEMGIALHQGQTVGVKQPSKVSWTLQMTALPDSIVLHGLPPTHPDPSLGEFERGPPDVGVSSLLRQGWTHKVSVLSVASGIHDSLSSLW